MVYTLENDQIRVQVLRKGAELSSIFGKQSQLEYVWQADPSVWPRHAPVLFPTVGKLRNNQYQWQGQTYSLPQHGFARDQEFEVFAQSADRLTLRLQANAETLKVYPFSFDLRITHALRGNRVEVHYEIINAGGEDMYFSIGAHPGFRCPLLPGETFEDYYLEFDQPETLDRHLIDGGLFSGETQPFLQNEKTIPLQRALFERDAIVVKQFRSHSLTLRSRRNPHSVKVSFAGFPFLGIWTKDATSPFVCIEPWLGLADRSTATGNLADKEGIHRLPARAEFACVHTIEVN